MALAPEHTGIGIRRHFTTPGVDPYDEVVWEHRDARIVNHRDGSVAFEQLDVEVPASWSQNATNIVAQKYFRGHLGTPQRERSVRQMVDRVAGTVADWGEAGGYFVDHAEAEAFRAELTFLLLTQRASFNSPVWFNIGMPGRRPQASACFILSVGDAMDEILNWYVEEGKIFRGGSGSGVNLSRLRASMEPLSSGGVASGPVSFMRGADASAGTIKSGGTTRRAAKMVILDADHPDIEEFVWCKAVEERKARVLRDAGFDMDLDGKDSFSLQYQNANNSVRFTDEFMRAVEADEEWHLIARTTGEVIRTVRARDLFQQVAEAAWECADPGVQFDTTINRWHTASNTGRINASNPCSEYMHLDNSACNLASLNLLSFLDDAGTFDVEGYRHAVEVIFTAQEILVGNAEYPTEKIAETTRRFRQLGLGYTNLGALLMALGLPYDSDAGRAWAGALTALTTGHAYAASARIASRMGPFAGFDENRKPMLRVLQMHRDAVAAIDEEQVPTELLSAAQEAWDDAVDLSHEYGVRNSQASVIAPTGTISFLMDADTTGIEPDLGLVKMKKLVGGGTMSIVNHTVPRALATLGYSPEQIADIVAHIDEHHSVLGAPHMAAEHLPVFACSMGDNVIGYMGHVRMMAAVQPFISGAISKCVAGDTLIPTADGLVRIGQLYRGEDPDTVRAEVIEVASVGGTQKTDAFYYGGPRPVREVVLDAGHRLIGTPNHRVLVAGGTGLAWRALADLEPGDAVAVQYGDELWSLTPSSLPAIEGAARAPAELDGEVAFLLGALGACGSIDADTIRLATPLEPVRRRAATMLRNGFGLDAADTVVAGCVALEARSAPLVSWLHQVGLPVDRAGRRVPDAVLASPREVVLSYLEGLAVAARVSLDERPRWVLCLDTPRLLDDVQALLTNLGLVHQRVHRVGELDGRPFDELRVEGESAWRLVDLVPLADPAEGARAAALSRTALLGDDPADVVPNVDASELRRLLPESEWHRFPDLADGGVITRRTLERVAAAPGVVLAPWLQSVLDDQIHFSPVRSVADAGWGEVYDLSVPGPHAFVTNGIVSHNTVNLPEDATVSDIEHLYLEAWRLGLKAVAIYRDNCKVAQPLSTGKKGAAGAVAREVERIVERVEVRTPVREKLPRTRTSKTFSFRVADCHGYVTVGEYADGRPGEIFVRVSKQGSTLAGVMDAFAISVSHGLQYGVPLKAFVDMFVNMRFEPAGITDDPDIRFASSLVDYIFRRLAVEYLPYDERVDLGILTTDERLQPTLPGVEEAVVESVRGQDVTPSEPVELAGFGPVEQRVAPIPGEPIDLTGPVEATGGPSVAVADAPYCMTCGIRMVRVGSCYACESCGSTSGCS